MLAQYYTTRTTGAASAGNFRLARADVISWRNQAGDGNLNLGVDSSNNLTFNGSTIQGSITIGALDAQAANATGLALVASVLSTQSADATHPGVVNNTAQTLSGVKTFSSNPIMSALTASQVVVTDGSKALASLAYASANTASALVQRDGSGNFTANIITAALVGNVTGNVSGNAGTVTTNANLTGPVTSVGNATSVTNNAITLAMMATMATASFLGRNSASTGNVEVLSATTATAILNAMVGDSGSGGTKGLVPAPSAGDAAAAKYLKANGLWDTPAGAGTVTSVAMTLPATLFTTPPTGSPVTTSGTLALALATQSAGLGFYGPASGSAAAPTFRAQGATEMAIGTLGAGSAINLGLACSVAASALTIALKQPDGSTDPSADIPVVVSFRNATATSGQYLRRSVTGALSIVIPSGATLGQTSLLDAYVWVYLIDNAGTLELAVSGVKLFKDKSIASSTTIGAGSTSGTTLYSTTGRSNVAIRLIGRLLVNETTAGTWAAAPSDVVIAPTPFPTVTDYGDPSWTPTGSWSANTTYSGVWSRIGDKFYGKVRIALAGAPTAASLTVNLPSGLTIDTSKGTYTANRTQLGYFNSLGGGGAGLFPGLVNYNSTTSVSLWYLGTSSGLNPTTVNDSNPVNATSPGTWANNDTIDIYLDGIPIVGWSTYGP